VAALMGLLLRSSALGIVLKFDYQYLLHAHSHVASLGWVYMMIYALLVYSYVPVETRRFERLFWVTQFSVFGMMISFPLQGYGLFSIIFSGLHIVCNYAFVVLLLSKGSFRNRLERTSVMLTGFFLVLTTLGIWSLALSLKFFGKGSTEYLLSIQFYLHFLFNGSFVFGILAILFRNSGSAFAAAVSSKAVNGVWWIAASVVFGFALPLMWFYPNPVWYNVYAVALVQQAAGIFILLSAFRSSLIGNLPKLSRLHKVIYSFVITGLAAKIFMQTFLLLPQLITAAFEIRNLFIGFIHLLMLGVVSGLLLSFLIDRFKLDTESIRLLLPIGLFVFGVLTTELMIFLQGFTYLIKSPAIPAYSEVLSGLSLLLVLSIVLILVYFVRLKPGKD
jgi:hypothetical protein